MSARPTAAVTTILFTDLVGSTELMQDMGDEPAQRIFEWHHRSLRETVTRSEGEVIEWTGDGVMAVFGSAADAVRCAISVQQGRGDDSLQIRIGLNVGEVLRQGTGSGYFGTPLVVARRLCDLAAPGQILCSSTVVALLAGRRAFRFRDLGTQSLKGIGEPVAMSEVLHGSGQAAALPLGKLKRLIEALPDIVVATDAQGMITFYNDGACEKLGYERQEITGRLVTQLYPSPNEARRVMAAMRDPERGGPGRVESLRTTLVGKAGRQIPVAISGVILYDATGHEEGTIGCAKDLGEI